MAPKVRPPIERFIAKVSIKENGCHEWTAYSGPNGYGRFYVAGRGALAHRWAYEYFVGTIPDGLQLDHLCRNRGCVNPAHLEPVTASENVRRGRSGEVARSRFSLITHCPRGHEYTPENTYMGGSGRTCRTCKRARAKAHYEANRESYVKKAADWRKSNPERARVSVRDSMRRLREKQIVS